MGRILDSLKQPAAEPPGSGNPYTNGAGPHLTAPPTPEPTEAGSTEEEADATVPFIEVGPHRSVEGSADVMAAKTPFVGPHLASPSPTPQPKPPEPALHVWGGGDNLPPCPATPPASAGSEQRARGPRLAGELLAYYRPEHALSRQYCQLAEQLLAPGVSGRAGVLLFSSTRPGCGTTTALLNLAISAARHTRKSVAVVEGNLRRPALAERLGLGEVPGLRDVLAGTVPLDRAMQETDQAHLFALTAGTPQPGQGLRCLAETMRSLLRQLRQRYDLVLVDGPRWDGQPDVVALGSACDAVYLVVSEQEAESAQVDELFQSIPEQGAHLAGCIVV